MLVRVSAHAAKGLAAKDLATGASDPFARIVVQPHGFASLGPASRTQSAANGAFREVGRTAFVRNTLDPDWEDTAKSDGGGFQFDVPVFDAERDVIAIEIFDHDFGKSDDFEGRVLIEVARLWEAPIKRQWIALSGRGLDNPETISGEALISAELVISAPAAAAPSASAAAVTADDEIPSPESSKAHSVSGHDFHFATYKKPTTCHTCKKLLFGISKQGLQCSRCNFISHKKCLGSDSLPTCQRNVGADAHAASTLSDKDGKLVAKLRATKKYQCAQEFAVTNHAASNFRLVETYAVFHNYRKDSRESCILVLAPTRVHQIHLAGGVLGRAKDETLFSVFGLRRVTHPAPNRLRFETHGGVVRDFDCPNAGMMISALIFNMRMLGFLTSLPFDVISADDSVSLLTASPTAQPISLLTSFPNAKFPMFVEYTQEVSGIAVGTIARAEVCQRDGPTKLFGDLAYKGVLTELPGNYNEHYRTFDPLSFSRSDKHNQAATVWRSELVHNFRSFSVFDAIAASSALETGLRRSSKANLVSAANIAGGSGSTTKHSDNSETSEVKKKFAQLGSAFDVTNELFQVLNQLELWETSRSCELSIMDMVPSKLIPLLRACAGRSQLKRIKWNAAAPEDEDCLEALTETFRYAPFLSQLEICGPKRLSSEWLHSLMLAVASNPHHAFRGLVISNCSLLKAVFGLSLNFVKDLHTLDLSRSMLGESGFQILRTKLPSTLRVLGLANTGLSASCTAAVCTTLGDSVPNLEILMIGGNSLEAGALLAKCAGMQNLRSLDVSGMTSESFLAPNIFGNFLAKSIRCNSLSFDDISGISNLDGILGTSSVNPCMTELAISANGFSPVHIQVGIGGLANALVSVTNLRSLSLERALPWDIGCWASLLGAVKQSPHLEHLSLALNAKIDNLTSQIAAEVARFLRSSAPGLQSFDIRGAGSRSDSKGSASKFGNAIADIADALSVNTTIRRIDLSGNGGTDEFGKKLGEALRKNRTLTSLRFHDNALGIEGLKAIRGAFYGNQKVTDLLIDEVEIDSVLGLLFQDFAFQQERAVAGKAELKVGYRESNSVLKNSGLRELVDAKKKQALLRYQIRAIRDMYLAMADAVARNAARESARAKALLSKKALTKFQRARRMHWLSLIQRAKRLSSDKAIAAPIADQLRRYLAVAANDVARSDIVIYNLAKILRQDSGIGSCDALKDLLQQCDAYLISTFIDQRPRHKFHPAADGCAESWSDLELEEFDDANFVYPVAEMLDDGLDISFFEGNAPAGNDMCESAHKKAALAVPPPLMIPTNIRGKEEFDGSHVLAVPPPSTILTKLQGKEEADNSQVYKSPDAPTRPIDSQSKEETDDARIDQATDTRDLVDLYGSAGPRDLGHDMDNDPDGFSPAVPSHFHGSSDEESSVDAQSWMFRIPHAHTGSSTYHGLRLTDNSLLRQFFDKRIERELVEIFRESLSTYPSLPLSPAGFDILPALCWSGARHGISHHAMSAVTQCSLDRFDRLKRLAVSLSSSSVATELCVAVYSHTLSEWKSRGHDLIMQWFTELEHSEEIFSVRIRVVPVIDLLDDDADIEKLYPINTLRNIALRAALNDTVLLVDVDFALDPNWSKLFVCGNPVAADKRVAIVLPAFELNSDFTTPVKTRQDIHQAVNLGVASAFHTEHFPAGHRATDFARWFAQTSDLCEQDYKRGAGTNRLVYSVDSTELIAGIKFRGYEVSYEEGFEPFCMVSRRALDQAGCMFDERFRAYGMNKIIFTYALNAAGFHFFVAHDAFLTAFEHPRSASWSRVFGSHPVIHEDNISRLQLKALFIVAKNDLQVQFSKNTAATAAIAVQ